MLYDVPLVRNKHPGPENSPNKNTMDCTVPKLRKKYHLPRWKAYHAPLLQQALQRQFQRPVYVDELYWGDDVSSTLKELIETERKIDLLEYSSGQGGAPCLPSDHGLLAGLSVEDEAEEEPRGQRFSNDCREFTANELGSRGDFHSVNKRFLAIPASTKAFGPAQERFEARKRVMTKMSPEKNVELMNIKHQVIPWNKEDLKGAADKEKGSRAVKAKDTQDGDFPGIGPAAHCFSYGILDQHLVDVQLNNPEGEALVAVQMGDRFVPPGRLRRGTSPVPLRGAAMLERAKTKEERPGRYEGNVRTRLNLSGVMSFQKLALQRVRLHNALAVVEEDLDCTTDSCAENCAGQVEGKGLLGRQGRSVSRGNDIVKVSLEGCEGGGR
ncbi:unnamed protein product, partial [Choristocarpus tenellus]